MKHERGLLGSKPFFKGTEAAEAMRAAKETFALAGTTTSLDESVLSAFEFLTANKKHYGPGPELVPTPIMTTEEIKGIGTPDPKRSVYSVHVSRENAIKKIVANGITHVLLELSQKGIFLPEFLESADHLIFDVTAEKVQEELLQRAELGHPSVLTFSGVLKLTQPDASRTRQQEVRDALTLCCVVGLLSGSYIEGDGYSFRIGPVLKATFKNAINPVLNNKFGFK